MIRMLMKNKKLPQIRIRRGLRLLRWPLGNKDKTKKAQMPAPAPTPTVTTTLPTATVAMK